VSFGFGHFWARSMRSPYLAKTAFAELAKNKKQKKKKTEGKKAVTKIHCTPLDLPVLLVFG